MVTLKCVLLLLFVTNDLIIGARCVHRDTFLSNAVNSYEDKVDSLGSASSDDSSDLHKRVHLKKHPLFLNQRAKLKPVPEFQKLRLKAITKKIQVPKLKPVSEFQKIKLKPNSNHEFQAVKLKPISYGPRRVHEPKSEDSSADE